MRRRVFGIVFGLALLLGGVGYLLDAVGLCSFQISFDGWWTAFIIFPALGGLMTAKDKLWNLLVLAVGVYLLLAARGIIEYGTFWNFFVPTAVILIGLKLIVRAIFGCEKKPKEESTEKREKDTCFAAFGGKEADFGGRDVKLAKLGAVFGGAECNLKDAQFEPNSQLDVFCLFGGADIYLPENIPVKVNTICLFGGISDERPAYAEKTKEAQLTINGFCMFGGVSVK